VKTVWVTRPPERVQQLAEALKKYHLRSWINSAMRIVDMDEDDSLRWFAVQSARFDMVIFVSAEAVLRCRTHLLPSPTLPMMLPIGSGTRVAMEKADYPVSLLSDNTIGDSDVLLSSDSLQPEQVREKCIAVLGGISGNDEKSISPPLCEALRQRGAQVTTFAAYRRLPPPSFSAKESATAQEMAATGQLCAAVAYSGDTARHMLVMTAPANDWLRRLPLFVIHSHIVLAAKDMGYFYPVLAPASSEGMAAAISHFVSGKLPDTINGL
jgi:uroporphyrinogen-III synthase